MQDNEGGFKYFTYADKKFKVPADWSQEQVGQAMAAFRDTEEFAKLVDYRKGAPNRVRMTVGSAKSPEDRLATLRKFYPDAQPYLDDNFVFTDPETGKPTIYNPHGLDVGDIFSVAREASITVGSGLGAAFGGAGGFVAGAPTGPGALLTGAKGAVAGAGLGAATTASVFDYIAEQTLGTEYSGGIVQRTGELALEATGAAVGERIGQVAGPAISQGVKRMLGGGTKRSEQVYNSLVKQKITPTAGAVTGGKGAGSIGASLDTSVGSTTIMREEAEQVVEQSRKAVENVAQKISGRYSIEETGIAAQQAIESSLGRFKDTQKMLEDKLAKELGADFAVPVQNVQALYNDLLSEVATMPRTTWNMYRPTLQIMKSLIDDAVEAGGEVPYSAFRSIRTMIGKQGADMNERATTKVMLDRIYGAMTQDIEDAVTAAGGSKLRQFRETMAFTKSFMEDNAKLFDKMVKLDAPDRAFRLIMNSARYGSSTLRKLRNEFTEDEWRVVSSSALSKLGYRNFGNESDDAFSIATFLTNYRKNLSPEAKDVLFDFAGKDGNTLRGALDELVDVFGEMEKSARLGNYSNTARSIHFMDLMKSLGYSGALAGSAVMAGGSPAAAATAFAGSVAGQVVLPRYTAKLITNPAFVKWLAEPVKDISEVGPHMARLFAIAQANPEIRDEIYQFAQSFKQEMTPNPLDEEQNQ